MPRHINYSRRTAREVNIGGVRIGADRPVAVQSMTNTPTMDAEASAAQVLALAKAGCDIVRLTAQTPAHAKNLGPIREAVRSAGCDVPLVADIHFNPEAAFTAAAIVEKVRINPGNFVDPGRTFKKLEYTDDEYAAELVKIANKLKPLIEICRSRGTALRIGVNHGSLSDRIMSRYGDTPAGVVESAMEFLRICRAEDFNDVVVSIKASNVTVMTATVRLMADTMAAEGMDYPLHLGVTEAGDGDDARIKSAVGIGSLLADGIGDTIRVSLSEDPVNEVPAGRLLLQHIAARAAAAPQPGDAEAVLEAPRRSVAVGAFGGGQMPLVLGLDFGPDDLPVGVMAVAARYPDVIGDARRALAKASGNAPVLVVAQYPAMDRDMLVTAASADLGSLVLDGYADAIGIVAPGLAEQDAHQLALGILQATRRRMSKTEYIACPGCGRTLFDLQATLAQVKAATAHLKGLKIGVMGCIVNGPGEMADADYGYVGAGPGRVSLYKNRTCVVKNIPAAEALPQLIQLIKDIGDWTDPLA